MPQFCLHLLHCHGRGAGGQVRQVLGPQILPVAEVIGEGRHCLQRLTGEHIPIPCAIDQEHRIIAAELTAKLIQRGYRRVFLIEETVHGHVPTGLTVDTKPQQEGDDGHGRQQPTAKAKHPAGCFGKGIGDAQ